jgi:hypothetical protein
VGDEAYVGGYLMRARIVLATSAVLAIGIGVALGWYLATQAQYKQQEDLLTYARFVQAKERAALVRFLEANETTKAQEMLYIVLAGNLRDYTEAHHGTGDPCEVLAALGGDYASGTQPLNGAAGRARSALVAQVQQLSSRCTANRKR